MDPGIQLRSFSGVHFQICSCAVDGDKMEALFGARSMSDIVKMLQVSQRQMDKGYKFYVEGYLPYDDLIFRRNGGVVYVESKCFRSMTKSEKFTILFSVPLSGGFEGTCACIAGKPGTCSHALGLAYLLEHLQRRNKPTLPEDVTCTSKPMAWLEPHARTVNPKPLSAMVFEKATAMPYPKERQVKSSVYQASKFASFETEELKGLSVSLDNLIKNPGTTDCVATNYGPVNKFSVLAFHLEHTRPAEEDIIETNDDCCFQPYFQLPACCISTLTPTMLEPLVTSEAQACEIEKQTKEQSKSTIWYQERKKRITSTTVHQVYKRKKAVDSSFLASVFKLSKMKPTSAMQRGLEMEDTILLKVMDKLKGQGRLPHFHSLGLCINVDHPMIASSPDGMIGHDDGQHIVLEMKFMTGIDFATKKGNCLEVFGEGWRLRKTHPYFLQCQTHMFCTGVARCYFAVLCGNDFHLEMIIYDADLYQKVVEKIEQFYVEHYEQIDEL